MPTPTRSSLILPLTIACAMLVENIDATVIATSLPVIARDIHENPIALKLALTSYLLSLAVFLPVSAWIADRFGSRTIFRMAIGVFMGGSWLCGFSNSLEAFVGARFLQGMGGALMVPVGRVVLMKSVEKSELVRAISYLTVPALLGPVIGPVLGGFISTYWNWRWIFFVNIPIGLAGIYLGGRYVPNYFGERTPLDVKGFLLSGIGFSTLTLGLATAGQHMLSWRASAVSAAIGVIMLALYVRHARRVAHPVLTLEFLRVPTYRVAVWGGALYRTAAGALPFLLPLLFQVGFGMTALQSGFLSCWSAVGAMGIKTQTSAMLRRHGFRKLLLGNTIVISLIVFGMSLFNAGTPYVLMLVVIFVTGFFRSVQYTSLSSLVYADIDKNRISPASGLLNVSDQLAQCAGITLAAYVIEIAAAVHGHTEVMANDFRMGFIMVALLVASSYLVLMRMPLNAGAAVSGAPLQDEAMT